jgi:hypothetical protein
MSGSGGGYISLRSYNTATWWLHTQDPAPFWAPSPAASPNYASHKRPINSVTRKAESEVALPWH